MTYDPTIPKDLPPPNVAVNQIRTNFSDYATVFSNNHIALNDTNQGKHSNVILQNQSTDPVVDGNFATLYGKTVLNTLGSSQQAFVRINQFLPTPISNTPMQLTYNSVNTAGPVYQSFLPGGFVYYFGQTSNISIPITLSPAPSEIVCAIANPNNFTTSGTPIPFDAAVAITQPNIFQITSAAATGVYTFTWMAIGKQ